MVSRLSRQFGVEEPKVVITSLPPMVLGAYDDRTDTIYISEDIIGNTSLLEHVVAHEFSHYLQDITGKIRPLDRFRPLRRIGIESEADEMAGKIVGLTGFRFRNMFNMRWLCALGYCKCSKNM